MLEMLFSLQIACRKQFSNSNAVSPMVDCWRSSLLPSGCFGSVAADQITQPTEPVCRRRWEPHGQYDRKREIACAEAAEQKAGE